MKMWEPTCGVIPGQENLDEVCVDRYLRGEGHAWLELAQNLHAEFINEISGCVVNDNILTTQDRESDLYWVWLKGTMEMFKLTYQITLSDVN